MTIVKKGVTLFIIAVILWLLYSIFWPKPTVVYLGDSLTKGTMVVPHSRYWAILEDRIRQNAIDLSKNGITAGEGATMYENYLKGNPNPDIVVIELGANDYLQGRNLMETKETLKTLVEFVKARGSVVVLVGFNPAYGRLDFDLYKDLADELNVIWCPDLLKDVWGKQELLLPDGLHPNYKGHEIMADNVESYLLKAIKQLK
jgi:acyl-CoA thioesterase I